MTRIAAQTRALRAAVAVGERIGARCEQTAREQELEVRSDRCRRLAKSKCKERIDTMLLTESNNEDTLKAILRALEGQALQVVQTPLISTSAQPVGQSEKFASHLRLANADDLLDSPCSCK